MDRETLINELTNVIGDYLKNKDLDLVDIVYRYEGKELILRILVDKPEGGISLDECAYLNNEISRILDEKDILKESYTLEVFSPGLDRPLEKKSDFLRCINRKAKFFLNEPIKGKMELEAVITKVEDDKVYVKIKGEIIAIPLSRINKAKQVI